MTKKKTGIRAGGLSSINHNQKIVKKTGIRAGLAGNNHNQKLLR